MKVLVACEESQIVTKEFRRIGHEAYSCDIEPCSGGHPEWHLKEDVIPLLNEGWDMILAFPPCTHLAISGTKWFEQKIRDGRQQQGIDFFMKFTNTNCPCVAIENSVGIMSTKYRKPDQVIQPWWFGESVSKRTCLWLKNLPLLKPTNVVPKNIPIISKHNKTIPAWYENERSFKRADRSKIRSRTFLGIAQAMADQWGN